MGGQFVDQPGAHAPPGTLSPAGLSTDGGSAGGLLVYREGMERLRSAETMLQREMVKGLRQRVLKRPEGYAADEAAGISGLGRRSDQLSRTRPPAYPNMVASEPVVVVLPACGWEPERGTRVGRECKE
jgi:hypothetical protein